MEQSTSEVLELLGVSPIGLLHYYPQITKPIAKPSDFGIGSREFIYWTKHGMIDFPKLKNGQSSWYRFNMFDAIWIRIIQELRKFSIPFKDILSIKKILFYNIVDILFSMPLNELQQILELKYNHQTSLKLVDNIEQLKMNSNLKDQIMNSINSTSLAALMYEAILFQKNIWLHFYYIDEEFKLNIDGLSFSDPNSKEYQIHQNHTHLNIHLNKLLSEFLVDFRFEKINKEFGFISENEEILFGMLRNGRVEEIIVKNDHQKNISFKLPLKFGLNNEETISLKKILRMNGYRDIYIRLKSGKRIKLKNGNN